jgi:hypothetical protein
MLTGGLEAWMVVVLIMHIGYFINSIFGWLNWQRGARYERTV